jgi:hypothetical protein
MRERNVFQPLAAAVRRLTEAIARADSPASSPHHAAFLEQLRTDHPPRALRPELRALWHHTRSAAIAGPATPFSVVLSVLLMATGIVALTVLPVPATYPDDPVGLTLARLLRLAGLIGLATACVLPGSRARRVFFRLALPTTMAGQLWLLLSAFPDRGRVMAVGDAFVRAAMVVGLLGCIAMFVGARRLPRVFSAGWVAFCGSLALLAWGQLVRASDFARRGDTLWVGASSVLIVGAGLLAVSLLRGATYYRRTIGLAAAV